MIVPMFPGGAQGIACKIGHFLRFCRLYLKLSLSTKCQSDPIEP